MRKSNGRSNPTFEVEPKAVLLRSQVKQSNREGSVNQRGSNVLLGCELVRVSACRRWCPMV